MTEFAHLFLSFSDLSKQRYSFACCSSAAVPDGIIAQTQTENLPLKIYIHFEPIRLWTPSKSELNALDAEDAEIAPGPKSSVFTVS